MNIYDVSTHHNILQIGLNPNIHSPKPKSLFFKDLSSLRFSLIFDNVHFLAYLTFPLVIQ